MFLKTIILQQLFNWYKLNVKLNFIISSSTSISFMIGDIYFISNFSSIYFNANGILIATIIKLCTLVQLSIESHHKLHDRYLCCFHLNKAWMSIVEQIWNIFVISSGKKCYIICNVCTEMFSYSNTATIV